MVAMNADFKGAILELAEPATARWRQRVTPAGDNADTRGEARAVLFLGAYATRRRIRHSKATPYARRTCVRGFRLVVQRLSQS
jgi:hypothetical protein